MNAKNAPLTAAPPALSARVQRLLLTALAHADGCSDCRRFHAQAARLLGCTGAEIESATRRAAHEHRTEVAMRYVLALQAGSNAADALRSMLDQCGFTEAQVASLEALVGIALHGHLSPDHRRGAASPGSATD